MHLLVRALAGTGNAQAADAPAPWPTLTLPGFHRPQVSFSDEKCKEKRVVMRYLLEKEEIFEKASVGAVYDGEAVLHCTGSPLALLK